MYVKKTTLYSKIEATSGTDSTPTAAANAIMAFDVELTINADMKERAPGNADRSAYADIRGKTTASITFKTELKGSGTAGTAPRWSPLIRACDRLETAAASSSVAYTPAATSETCTIWINIDGVLHKMAGCAGECEVDLVAGDVPYLKFDMKGVYALPTDSAVEAMTYDTTVPVIVKNSTTTLNNYAAIIEKINFKFGNTVVERPSFAAAEGVLAFMVTDRKPSGVLTCEMVLRATASADFWNYFHYGVSRAFVETLGATTGNIVRINAPACVLGAPKYGDREGLRMVDVPFQLARSAAGGNDEMTITLT